MQPTAAKYRFFFGQFGIETLTIPESVNSFESDMNLNYFTFELNIMYYTYGWLSCNNMS